MQTKILSLAIISLVLLTFLSGCTNSNTPPANNGNNGDNGTNTTITAEQKAQINENLNGLTTLSGDLDGLNTSSNGLSDPLEGAETSLGDDE